MTVVVVGDALIDEMHEADGVREYVGGAGLNVAVGLARLGVPTTLIAMVGDDVPGEIIRTYLREYGVELLASPSQRGSSRAISNRANNEPFYVFNEAARERRVHFGPAERHAMAQADYVVISCFPFDNTEQTNAFADAVAGSRLIIDANPRVGMMHDADEFLRGFEALAAGATLVKVGGDDAELLYGRPVEWLRDRLVELGSYAVLATAGSDGANVAVEGTIVARPIADQPGAIIDTMGAGDATLATMVAGLVEQWPSDADAWGENLGRAMEVAAATCRYEGALLRLPVEN